MKIRKGFDNKEMKQTILDRLAQVEFTDCYAFAIRDEKMVKAAIVEHAHDILPLITYCERQASSKGGCWGVRMWNSADCFSIIKDYASEIIPLCSVSEFERSYAEAAAASEKGFIPGYRGEWFERWFVKMVGGIRPEKRTAKCTESGDVILNGQHIQLKLWNATIITETQVNLFYSEYIKNRG